MPARRFPPPWSVIRIVLRVAEHRLKRRPAMPTRRFEWIAPKQLLVGGCAVVFGACVLIEHPQAQPGYVPPPTPLPPPVFNPSSPSTVPQPSYRPITPTTPSATPSAPSTVPSGDVTSPANEEPPSTTARSELP